MSPLAGTVDPVSISSPLHELEEIAADAGLDSLRAEIRRADADLARGALTVAVLGQFKRGKSTLLNAFAGAEVFPMGILPQTAVATHLVRGPEGARVVEPDGRSRPVALTEIPDYVSEQQNPGNRRAIARVEISMPLPDWTDGITFVDSPGIGSPHDANTAAARALLPHVDAAIFVLSPDPSITADEIAFLAEASRYAARLFFVLNKADLVPADDLAELERYLHGILTQRCGFPSIRLYRASARVALEGARQGDPELVRRSGIADLWGDLRAFVDTDRTESVREVRAKRVRQFSGQLRGLIDLALNADQMTQDEFDRRLAALDQGIREIRVEHRATQAMLREEVDVLSRSMASRAGELLAPRGPSLAAGLDRYLAEQKGGSASATVRRFEAELQRRVGETVAEVRSSLVATCTDEMEHVARTFRTRLEGWLFELATVVAREYSVDLPVLSVTGHLADPVRYTDRIERLYEGTVAGQTALLLPSGVMRRRLRGRLSTLVADELDAQAGRLSSDLRDRIDRSWNGLSADVHEQLDQVVARLEGALALGRQRRADSRQTGAPWSVRMAVLRQRVEQIERGSLAPALGRKA